MSDDTTHVLAGAQGEALETLKDRKASQKLNASIDFTPFSLGFRPTLVVKIKKMQESTPRFLKRITEDKENIILLPVDWGLSP